MSNSGSAAVAATVRAELARRKLTQGDLARTLEVSQVAVSRRLRGETAFTLDELFAIARYFDMRVEDLVGVAA